MDATKETLAEIWANKYAAAGIIVVASAVLAFVVKTLATGIGARLVRKTRTDLDDRILALARGPIITTVILIGVGIATRRLEWGDGFNVAATRILASIGLVIWSYSAFKLTKLLLQAASKHPTRFRAVEDRTFPLFDNAAKVLLLGAVVYIALSIWKIDASGWLASAGIVGIAVGFAAKDTLSNLFAGLFIIVDAPYRVGDYVNLNSGERGKVVHIGIRSTRLATRDDMEITIPNAVMGNAKVVNETKGKWDKRRIRIKVGVAYDADIDRVRQVLVECARAESGACTNPPPKVRFRAFGDYCLMFELLCWIEEPEFRGRVTDALNCAVIKRFREEGIEIPFPKQDITFTNQTVPNSETTSD